MVLSYAVLTAETGRAMDRARLWYAGPPDVPDLFFWPDEHIVWSSPRRAITFVGWQALSEHPEHGSHWASSHGSLTAFSGYPLRTHRPWESARPWSEQLHERILDRGLQCVLDDLVGVYTLVHIDRDENVIVASDPIGTGLVYVARTNTHAVVSNRAALAARLVGRPGTPPARSVEGSGWLVLFGYPMCDDTTYEHVRLAPFGHHTRIGRDGSLGFEPRGPVPWRTGEENRSGDDVRDAVAALLAHAQAAVSLPVDERLVMLSGGKDTRLVLALLSALGQTDRFCYRTNGDADAPDVLAAMELAETYDLDHSYGQSSGEGLGLDEFDLRVREHVALTSGMLSPMSLRVSRTASTRLTFGGLFGETLRSHYAKDFHAATPGDVRTFFYEHLPLNAGSLLKPEAASRYRQRLWRWAQDLLDAGTDPADIPDVFYLTQRARTWIGPQHELMETGAPLINPLYTLTAIRAAFRLGPVARRRDRLHFDLIHALDPRLLRLGLANDTWHDEHWRRHGYDPAKQAPPRIERTRPRPATWQSRAFDRYEPYFREVLDDPTNPVYDIADRRAALDAIRDERRLTPHARVNLYSLLGAAVWLGRREEPVRYR